MPGIRCMRNWSNSPQALLRERMKLSASFDLPEVLMARWLSTRERKLFLGMILTLIGQRLLFKLFLNKVGFLSSAVHRFQRPDCNGCKAIPESRRSCGHGQPLISNR